MQIDHSEAADFSPGRSGARSGRPGAAPSLPGHTGSAAGFARVPVASTAAELLELKPPPAPGSEPVAACVLLWPSSVAAAGQGLLCMRVPCRRVCRHVRSWPQSLLGGAADLLASPSRGTETAQPLEACPGDRVEPRQERRSLEERLPVVDTSRRGGRALVTQHPVLRKRPAPQLPGTRSDGCLFTSERFRHPDVQK